MKTLEQRRASYLKRAARHLRKRVSKVFRKPTVHFLDLVSPEEKAATLKKYRTSWLQSEGA